MLSPSSIQVVFKTPVAPSAFPSVHKLPDVGERRVVVGENAAPVAHARRHPCFQAHIAEGLDQIHKGRPGVVVPRHRDHIVRQILEVLGVLNAHVAPEQNLAMIRAQGLVDLAEVIDVDLAIALRVDFRLGASLTQFLGFIRPDMEEGAGENRRQVREHLANKSEGPRRGGREHVAVRHLSQILEPLILERHGAGARRTPAPGRSSRGTARRTAPVPSLLPE